MTRRVAPVWRIDEGPRACHRAGEFADACGDWPPNAHMTGVSRDCIVCARSGLRRRPGRLSLCPMGIKFVHPLGLAAGFDKNGDYLDALGALGFSHIELGTVTPRPQPGNPKPRMFRVPGAARTGEPHGLQQQGRRSPRRHGWHAPATRASAESASARMPTRPWSGRTGLPALHAQGVRTCRLHRGQHILPEHRALARTAGPGRTGTDLGSAPRGARGARQGAMPKRVPLLVKIAPDLDAEQLGALAANLRAFGIDGVIATNTTTDLSASGRRLARRAARRPERGATACRAPWP